MSGIPKTLMSEVMPSWWHATLNKKSIEVLVLTGSHGDYAVYPKKNGDKVYICVNDYGKMVQYSIVIVNPHECRFAGFVSSNIEECVNGVIELSRKQPFASKSKPNAGLSLKDPVKIERKMSSMQRQMSKSLFDDDDDDDFVIAKPTATATGLEGTKPESTAPTMTSKVAAMLADDVDDDFDLPSAVPLDDVVKSADDIEISFVKTSATVGLVVLDPQKGKKYPMLSEILSTSPAAGLLSPKDEIVGVNGKSMEGQKKAAVLGLIRATPSTSTLTFVIKRSAPKVKKQTSPVKASSKTPLHEVSAPVTSPTPTPTPTPAPAPTPTKHAKPLVVEKKTSTTSKNSSTSLFDDTEEVEEESVGVKEVVPEPKSLFTEEDDEENDDYDSDHDYNDNDDNDDEDNDDGNADNDVEAVDVKKPNKIVTINTKTTPKKRSIFDEEDEDEEEITGGGDDGDDDNDDDNELDNLLGDDDDDLDSLMNSNQTKKKNTTMKPKKKGSSLFDDDDDGDTASGGDFDVTDLGSLQKYLKANEGK